MKVSSFLFEFHKLCEGVHSEAYLDPVGILTIGVGHANQETATFNKHSKWSDEKIREVWELDVAEAERLANQYLEGIEIPQCYFDTLVDIIFNTGAKPTTMLKYLKAGNYEGAKHQILRWIYSNGVVLLGLVKRRFTMYAYCDGYESWLDIANIPLSSKNLNDFNEVMQKFGYQVESTNERPKFVISRFNGE